MESNKKFQMTHEKFVKLFGIILEDEDDETVQENSPEKYVIEIREEDD